MEVWSSAVEGALELFGGGISGAVHWVKYWGSALAGIILALTWRETRSSAVEGALEKCIGGRQGAVDWSEHWSSAVKVGI